MKSKRKVNKIILHCSATPEGRDVSVDTIRGWHVNERGWSDIGYHYIIKLDGSIKNGRSAERQGAHVRGHNKKSVGVCYVGGCDKEMNPKDTRTKEQKKALAALIVDLMNEYPGSTLHGHNEFASKACPSFDVQQEYSEIIKDFKECE